MIVYHYVPDSFSIMRQQANSVPGQHTVTKGIDFLFKKKQYIIYRVEFAKAWAKGRA